MGNIMDIVRNIIALVILLPMIVAMARQAEKKPGNLLPIFFTCAMITYSFSVIYYMVYELLRPGTRMPFAVNEIAECATVLFMCAGLEILLDRKRAGRLPAMLFSALFTGAHIALWIVWTGEWMQDIVFGLPYIYLLYLLIRGNDQYQTIGFAEGMVALIGGLMVLLLLGGNLFTSGMIHFVIEKTSYAIAFLLIVWLVVLCKKAIRVSGVKAVFLTVTLFWWTWMVMFMTDGIYYGIADWINIFLVPVLYLALKKEDDEHGLC